LERRLRRVLRVKQLEANMRRATSPPIVGSASHGCWQGRGGASDWAVLVAPCLCQSAYEVPSRSGAQVMRTCNVRSSLNLTSAESNVVALQLQARVRQAVLRPAHCQRLRPQWQKNLTRRPSLPCKRQEFENEIRIQCHGNKSKM
jgi:hypothetical protein